MDDYYDSIGAIADRVHHASVSVQRWAVPIIVD